MFAIIKTNQGDIKVELFADKAPQTVANFAGLSEGTKDWLDPKTGKKVTGRSLYQNTIFHRVIKGFMIQGGDPLGTGTGGPGYRFADEFSPDLSFDQEGLLAMANSGQNTNGSQFFITTIPTPWLNQRHTIFGKVVEGMDVVLNISSTKTGANDKPVKDILIQSIQIIRS
ncbi:peptidylprolyl isomerase [Candidatus Collierbacteria bacterium]|nr:peptidylprolyl isomerase [Candidatus Collierbacteria bacterium]